MSLYQVTVKNDNGIKKLEVMAFSKEQASSLICMFENCPPEAITRIKDISDIQLLFPKRHVQR